MPDNNEVRIKQTDTVKDCYKEINLCLEVCINNISKILVEARLNTKLEETGLTVVLKNGRDIINELKEQKLPI